MSIILKIHEKYRSTSLCRKASLFPRKKPRWQEDLDSKETKYSHEPIKELLRKTLLDFPAKESGI